jgi:pyruvate dehydrogenase E1 component alpha subunit
MHLLAPEQGILGTVPIVGGTVPLAAGAAMAYKMRREPRVAAAFFGDGTLEEGHVHESMNLAALYRLPVIFICENNLYSSHMHWSERRVSDNLDRAGEFHSIPGGRIDGNDVEAVYQAASAAVATARRGQGPSFLECRTFRWRGHVGASSDIDVGVQRRGESEQWMAKDPLARAEARLRESGIHGFDENETREEIQTALDRARAAPFPLPERRFEHVYAEAACAY